MPEPVDNPYIFGDDATDRYRLEAQTSLFSGYLQASASRLVGSKVSSILELGCGEGQLGRTLLAVYPEARLVGIDKDQQAVAKARAMAEQEGLQAEYVAGNIEQGLPTGPFNLVYASLVAVYLQDLPALVRSVYERLEPGGHFWVKDFDVAGVRTAAEYPQYRELAGLFFDTVTALRAHPDAGTQMPDLMQAGGFEAIVVDIERYPLGGQTEQGRTMLSVTLGAAYNSRKMSSKLLKVDEAHIEQLYVDTINKALLTPEALGVEPFANVVGRKPIGA